MTPATVYSWRGAAEVHRPVWRVWVDALLDAVPVSGSRLPTGLRSRCVFAWLTDAAPVEMPPGRRTVPLSVRPELTCVAPYAPIDRILSNAGIERVRAAVADSFYPMAHAREHLVFLDHPQTRMATTHGHAAIAGTAPELLDLVVRALQPELTEYLTGAHTLLSHLTAPPPGTWEVLVPTEALLALP